MKEFKGTPGPWVVDGAGVGAEFNIDSADGGTSVGITSQIFRDKDHEIRIANANLIAAAPDLLEALMDVLSEFESLIDAAWESTEDHDKERINKARSAIAKALGESK